MSPGMLRYPPLSASPDLAPARVPRNLRDVPPTFNPVFFFVPLRFRVLSLALSCADDSPPLSAGDNIQFVPVRLLSERALLPLPLPITYTYSGSERRGAFSRRRLIDKRFRESGIYVTRLSR